jgi:hypothetical protein
MKKVSELFEGPQSSLRKAYDEAVRVSDFTVADALRWSDKHRKLSNNEGVRVVHIQQLLKARDKEWVAIIDATKKPDKEWDCKCGSRHTSTYPGWNEALDTLKERMGYGKK